MIPKGIQRLASDDARPIRRVLVVDDVPEIGALYRSMFRRIKSLQVQTVVELRSRNAIERLRSEPFDLVITDFRMPDGTGDAVIRAAAEFQPQCPVVLMSGYLALGSREGIAAQLAKPLEMDAILSLVTDLLTPPAVEIP